jgi:L-threonylcarbamoyladenylate synthase
LTPATLPLKTSNLAHAARIVKGGGLIVYPTDTVYGLGCDPMNEVALSRLFAAKRRSAKPIPLMCDSLETASKLVVLSPRAVEVARRFWPGALTIVAPLAARLPFLIHQGSGTLGVRVSGSSLCRELVAMCGGVLTGTSANVSGRGPCRTAAEAERAIGSAVDLILDGGRLASAESTVVRVTDAGIEVLRQGAVRVTEKDIRP